MNDIDQKIQAALRQEPTGDPFNEPSLAEELIAAFRGRHRWHSALAIIVTLVAFSGVIWSVVRFFNAGDVTLQLRWGGLAAVLLMIVAFLKLWFWLEMHTNRVLREVKRVELLFLSRLQK